MTAEIAILNRSALALAADSAVTISVGNKTKVYDTAEKLFELSRRQPLALMIYNNVEFVGVPLDVLIRRYRRDRANKRIFSTVKAVADDFLTYLRTFKHDIIEEQKYLYAVLREKLRLVNDAHSKALRDALNEFRKSPNVSDLPDPLELLIELVREETTRQLAAPLKGYLDDVTLEDFTKSFGKVSNQVADSVFKAMDLNDELYEAVMELAFNLIKGKEGSDLLTGLVFGGFASRDMFPTLRYMEIDGVFFGRVKVLSTREVDIDRMKTRAEVVPFAQKEMVERFMYGLDTELEEDIDKFMKSALDDIIDAVGTGVSSKAREATRKKVAERRSKMISRLKERSRQDLLDVVYFMSKKELADIAYALVELTSHKRRFSTDEQTVGGPIDVAILTKSEGFVWIRRKHYFNPEVNQCYLERLKARVGDQDGR